MNITHLGEGLKYRYFYDKVSWLEYLDLALFSITISTTDVTTQYRRHNNLVKFFITLYYLATRFD